jgi:hypothetical protein
VSLVSGPTADGLIEEAKLITAQGGGPEQVIKIEGGLPELPGTRVEMPVPNGHAAVGGRLLPPTPEATDAPTDPKSSG